MILKYRMHLNKYRLSEIIVVENNLFFTCRCIHVCLLRRHIPIQILAAHFEN